MQWHVRDGLKDGNYYNIIYHIPIPSTNNAVGVNYQTAIIQSNIGGTTVMATGVLSGQITVSEYNQIISGQILEYREPFYTNPSQNLSTLASLVNNRYSELASVTGSFIVELANRLKYWGGQSSS
jgi:hypothetical protein